MIYYNISLIIKYTSTNCISKGYNFISEINNKSKTYIPTLWPSSDIAYAY